MEEGKKEEGAKLEFSPVIFDPNKEQLQAIAAEVAQITADPASMTKEDLELINSTKNKLVKARTAIEKAGKAARAEALAYQKKVIAYEDELIAIIEPEEKRLKELEKAAKEYAMQQERLKTLPEYKERLASIGDDVAVTDEWLLTLDPNGRDAYYNERLGAKLQKDKEAADALRAQEEIKRQEEERERQAAAKKIEEEKAAIEREKQRLADERKNGRIQRLVSIGFKATGAADGLFYRFDDALKITLTQIEGIEDQDFNKFFEGAENYIAQVNAKAAEAAEKKRLQDIEDAKAQAIKDAEAEKQRLAEKEAAEAAERSRAEAYHAFLRDSGYNPETDIVDFKDGVSTIYRKIASYNHPKT